MDTREFLDKYEIPLNDQQEQALERIDGKTLLLAVPGSGKTTVIISRLGYMIKELKIEPEEILTLTFSKLGVADLKKRYDEIFGIHTESPQISTIHSFAFGVIRTCQKRTGRVNYQVVENKKGLITALYKKIFYERPTEATVQEFERKLTLAKNLLLSEEEQKKLFGPEYKIKQAYEKYKRQERLIDFDDMLIYAYRLLDKNPALLEEYRERFRYIQVDEAQDNSKIQDALIKLLVGEDGNLFMVADEDQSIYGFRGAYPEWVLNFKDYYPEGEVIMMESNYRTTKSLAEPAGEFIQLNEGRYDKNMVAVNDAGVPAKHEYFKTVDERDQYIIDSLADDLDTAVLFRNNDSAVELVDILDREGVAFNLRESNPSFFSNFLMRDLVTFFELARDPTNVEAFNRLWYKCEAHISRENFDRFREYYHSGSVWDTLERLNYPDWLKDEIIALGENFKDLFELSPTDFLDTVFYKIGYQNYLDYIGESVLKLEKIEQKKNILETLAKRQKTVRDFFVRLQELEALMKSAHLQNAPLTLSTIHGAKGLEFEKVFMVDVSENILPAVEDSSTEENRRLYLEEIRLFYVGVTRAKRELEFLSVGTPKRQPMGHEVSPFIDLYFGTKET